MNVIYFLGNGFDLQLGMDTGYKSFLEWYVDLKTDDPELTKFRDYLKDDKSEWWSDAEIAMGQYLGNFFDDNINVYFKNIRDFKLRLSEYLLEQNLKYDLENDPNVIAAFKDFMTKSADDVMLRPGILHLSAKRRYADTDMHFVTFNYTDAIDRLCAKIKETSSTLESFSNGMTTVRTRIGNIYHVHGTLDSSLIMGVDNYEQLNSSKITDFSKLSRTLIKPIVNDELGREEHENAISMLNDSNYLFFYGLSFGVTDQTWWNLISDRLMKNGNCQAVIFTRSSVKATKPTEG